MELKNIESLLEKYEEGQTSLQEEAQLKHYFTTETVAPHLEVYRSLFTYFVSDKQLSYQRPLSATRHNSNKYRWFASAAVVTIMFSAFMTLTSKDEFIKLSNEEQFAYNETLKAFDLISNQMHKGAVPLNALDMISTSFEQGQQNVVFLEEFNNSTNKIFNIK
jgi:cystathionine beta-lyase/cystathionine gamma-synthase